MPISQINGLDIHALLADTSTSASYATNASTADLATTASYVATTQTASYALTASFVTTAQTASYVLNAVSSSRAITSSLALTASFVVTAQTASYVLNAISSSYAATASYVTSALTASFLNTLNQNVIIRPPATSSGIGLIISGSGTKGNANYIDFLQVTNTSASIANPNKYFRLNGVGDLEILNSGYTGVLMTVSNNGNASLGGSLTMPARPAFRVYGSGTTSGLTTTQNGDGTLNQNNWAVDYQQGSALTGSTGIFTAPIAGLYQVNLICRNAGNANFSQLAVLKNNSIAAGGVQIMIEFAGNSTMNHTGGSTITYLAAGDTLRIKVLANTITFDGNDSWAVAYIG